MKLPEEVRQKIFAVGGYREKVTDEGTKRDEAIVRDCAEVAAYATHPVSVHPGTEPRGHEEQRAIEHRHLIEVAILARYGLEPKK